MKPMSRRAFVTRGAACWTLAGAIIPIAAAAAAHVAEDDETAVALGYRHDTRQVDAKKFARHAADQRCGNCSFFQGGPQDEWGGCAMFGRKHVAAAGWCTAWNKLPG